MTIDALDLFGGTPRSVAIDKLHAATAIYTAEPIVMDLLDRVSWPAGNRTLFDASCGNGSFIKAATAKLLSADPGISPAQVLQRLQGWEIHAYAAAEAVRSVSAVFKQYGWPDEVSTCTAAGMIVNEDFLTATTGQRTFSVIVGNPPYLRYANVPDILRTEYDAVLPSYARADLLHSFLNRCLEVLDPDGEIALVTADRWLFNMGAATLREIMGKRVAIDYLKRLDATTAFYRPKTRAAGTPPRIHPVAVILRGGHNGIPLGRAAVYPDALDSDDVPGTTLADVASVRICPWLGKEGIFVVNEAVARQLPPECTVPAVDTDDIKDGVLQTPYRFAIRTIPGVEPPAEVVKHLKSSMHRLPATGQRLKDWFMPPESFHALSLENEALLVPRIARGLKCVRLPIGVLGINHNLTVVSQGKVNINDLEQVLNSRKAQEWVAARAARLENGFYSITTSLLRKLPWFLEGGF